MGFLYESSFLVFLIITVIGGGGAAYMAGRSGAKGWQPVWLLVVYMMIFGAGLRFLHFALYQETLTSGLYYVSQTAVVICFALLGYRITRVNQMTTKYPWLYEKTNPFSWRDKTKI
jgi:hypothetical protein